MSEIKISYNFEGDVALVTGAGAGIGLATAIAFAKAGAAVVLSDINEDLLIIETEKLRTAGYTVSSFKCDVADESTPEISSMKLILNSMMGFAIIYY